MAIVMTLAKVPFTLMMRVVYNSSMTPKATKVPMIA